MLAYAGRFEWARVATWVFWPLYLFLPVNSAVFLWRLRDWQPPEPLIHAARLTVLALVLGGYGLAAARRSRSARPASGPGRSTRSTPASTPPPT